MTLFFDGIPSSGGPRCFGCLGGRGLLSLGVSIVVVPSAPFSAVRASFVVSVKGATWPGTLVGPSLLTCCYRNT